MGMQSLIYYLLAVIVGFAALLIVSSVVLRGQASSVDSVQIMRAKTSLMAAVDNIELDFRNMGAGTAGQSAAFPASPIDTLVCTMRSRNPCVFRFYGRVDPAVESPSLVEYLWNRDGADIVDTDLSSKTDEPEVVKTYMLRRKVDGVQKSAIGGVRQFGLRFFDADGKATTELAAVRSVDVALRVLVPTTQTDEQIEEVTWRSTFRPVNLFIER
jgi:hypothetical protein